LYPSLQTWRAFSSYPTNLHPRYQKSQEVDGGCVQAQRCEDKSQICEPDNSRGKVCDSWEIILGYNLIIMHERKKTKKWLTARYLHLVS
jgi:hypothetical protein